MVLVNSLSNKKSFFAVWILHFIFLKDYNMTSHILKDLQIRPLPYSFINSRQDYCNVTSFMNDPLSYITICFPLRLPFRVTHLFQIWQQRIKHFLMMHFWPPFYSSFKFSFLSLKPGLPPPLVPLNMTRNFFKSLIFLISITIQGDLGTI